MPLEARHVRVMNLIHITAQFGRNIEAKAGTACNQNVLLPCWLLIWNLLAFLRFLFRQDEEILLNQQ